MQSVIKKNRKEKIKWAGERCDSEELLATVTILIKRMVIKLHIMRK